MPRIEIIIAIIFALVWVIANIAKTAGEQQKAPPRRRPPAPNTNTNAGKGSSEIDKFLEEIERLRKKQDDKPAPVQAGGSGMTSGRVTTTPKAAPQVAGRARRPASPPVAPPPPPSRRVRQEPIVAEVVDVPPSEERSRRVSQEPSPTTPPLPPPPPTVYTPPEIPAQPTATPQVTFAQLTAQPTRRQPTPAISGNTAAILRKLLASPQGMSAAFVLKEILDEPRHKRYLQREGE